MPLLQSCARSHGFVCETGRTAKHLGRMAASNKKARRAIWSAAAGIRRAVAARTPERIKRKVGPMVHYVDMLLLDHLVFRLVFPNRHKVSDGVWRAAQPLPHQVAAAKRMGVRTIVNLRGASDLATYAYEREACRRAGVKLVDFEMKSRRAPTVGELHAARELFQSVEYPILMHCKSGADRAGLMSVLYCHVHEGVPMEKAIRHLSLRYGHISQASTGILDYFFAAYLAADARRPIAFFDWVDTGYNQKRLQREFKASGWANRLVDGVLRRE
jgi:protein tyrosine/serine phosphatase